MARVLLVDDSIMIRKAFRIYLEGGNHEVVFEATNGSEAVWAYKKYNPDIVTMDVSMPGMDGLNALKEIMKFDANAKVIMVSAMNERSLVMDAIKNGAKNYLLKPALKKKVLSVVESALSVN